MILARLRRKLGRRGHALAAEFDRLGFTSLKAVADAAKIDVGTIRRLMYEDGSSMFIETFDALSAVGVSKDALRT